MIYQFIFLKTWPQPPLLIKLSQVKIIFSRANQQKSLNLSEKSISIKNVTTISHHHPNKKMKWIHMLVFHSPTQSPHSKTRKFIFTITQNNLTIINPTNIYISHSSTNLTSCPNLQHIDISVHYFIHSLQS